MVDVRAGLLSLLPQSGFQQPGFQRSGLLLSRRLLPGLLLPGLLLSGLAACTAPPLPGSPSQVAFTCMPEGTTRGRPAAATGISVSFDATERPLTLGLGDPVQDDFVLEPVAGMAGVYSAGDRFGWRGTPQGGSLTDIQAAVRFSCHRAPARGG